MKKKLFVSIHNVLPICFVNSIFDCVINYIVINAWLIHLINSMLDMSRPNTILLTLIADTSIYLRKYPVFD